VTGHDLSNLADVIDAPVGYYEHRILVDNSDCSLARYVRVLPTFAPS